MIRCGIFFGPKDFVALLPTREGIFMFTDNPNFRPPPGWKDAKRQAKDILISIAKRRELITYLVLSRQITYVRFEPHSKLFFYFLGEISAAQAAVSRPMLTAIVVRQDDGRPGDGFFELGKLPRSRCQRP
jgi:hypothetical protein